MLVAESLAGSFGGSVLSAFRQEVTETFKSKKAAISQPIDTNCLDIVFITLYFTCLQESEFIYLWVNAHLISVQAIAGNTAGIE